VHEPRPGHAAGVIDKLGVAGLPGQLADREQVTRSATGLARLDGHLRLNATVGSGVT